MKTILFSTLIALITLSSCAHKKVQRVGENTETNLSGRWNESDSRIVAEEMIKEGLSKAWISDFTTANSKKPTIVIGTVKNKSSEHISSETFVKDIEREFVNSGKVKVVQGGEGREALRKERADQKDFVSPETAKKFGKEVGADFLLQGTINSISDANKKEKSIFYQVDMEIINIETNEKEWIGSKKIKKMIK